MPMSATFTKDAKGSHSSKFRNKQAPPKADHPERPTITLGWSFGHPLGILTNSVFLLDSLGTCT